MTASTNVDVKEKEIVTNTSSQSGAPAASASGTLLGRAVDKETFDKAAEYLWSKKLWKLKEIAPGQYQITRLDLDRKPKQIPISIEEIKDFARPADYSRYRSSEAYESAQKALEDV